MTKFFESIPHFANLRKSLEKMYDKPLALTFQGSVKMHGTNSSIIYHPDTGVVARSRSRELSTGSDNFGFYEFAMEQVDVWNNIYQNIILGGSEEDHTHPVEFYGEWIGPGIQRGVGISQIPRRVFVIFEIRHGSRGVLWEASALRNAVGNHERVFSIGDFGSCPLIDISFDFAHEALPTLQEFTDSVEEKCPVAKFFGVDGIGEGLVWTAKIPGGGIVRFKHKGQAHTETPIKVVTPNDESEMRLMSEVSNSLTVERLKQGVIHLEDNDLPLDPTSIGEFIKWVSNNIQDEESAYLDELDPKVRKRFFGKVGGAAAQWFKSEVLA